jgi:hypothetical protein
MLMLAEEADRQRHRGSRIGISLDESLEGAGGFVG